jgi:hypothetical protein
MFMKWFVWQDVEVSGDNFLLPAFNRLCRTTAKINDGEIQASRTALFQILTNRFETFFEGSVNNTINLAIETEEQRDASFPGTMDTDDEDDDGPVVVPNEEIEASVARYSQSPTKPNLPKEEYPSSLKARYPVLFAAKLNHEDILMTCASIPILGSWPDKSHASCFY